MPRHLLFVRGVGGVRVGEVIESVAGGGDAIESQRSVGVSLNLELRKRGAPPGTREHDRDGPDDVATGKEGQLGHLLLLLELLDRLFVHVKHSPEPLVPPLEKFLLRVGVLAQKRHKARSTHVVVPVPVDRDVEGGVAGEGQGLDVLVEWAALGRDLRVEGGG